MRRSVPVAEQPPSVSPGPSSVGDSPADGAPPRPGPPANRRARPWLGPLLLLVVLATALVVGSGVGQGGHETPAQRATALDAELRCPSCEDLSVAQSSASTAVAVRHEVLQLARRGESDQQIEDALVGQYGTAILLRPPTSGLASLVWIVPAVAGIVAAAALGVLFWRRSRQMSRLRGGSK
jgi:cytochrome c-type biogenesis protein CcmH